MLRVMATSLGWALRASALICVLWTIGRVLGGGIDSVAGIAEAAVWHGAFALSGVALVAAGRTPVTSRAEQPAAR